MYRGVARLIAHPQLLGFRRQFLHGQLPFVFGHLAIGFQFFKLDAAVGSELVMFDLLLFL
jgi:hypothetical protein